MKRGANLLYILVPFGEIRRFAAFVICESRKYCCLKNTVVTIPIKEGNLTQKRIRRQVWVDLGNCAYLWKIFSYAPLKGILGVRKGLQD